jgi:putative SOS response-associated peptidase YedK
MCGRFNLTSPKEIEERFGFLDWHERRIEPRFNIAPSQEILTIVQLPLEKPIVQTAIWGLKPFWLDKGSKKPPPINARAEALVSSPMFREARRCLIPATGFYEWRNHQPMHILLKDERVFAFAGVWLPPGKGSGLPTVAIVTTKPNELVATIHNRMPAILRPEDEQKWLDPSVPPAEAQTCLEPIEPETLKAYPINSLVNSWENEGSALVEAASITVEQPPLL